MTLEGVRSAASFEGLVILAVIYGILSVLGKLGEKQRRSRKAPSAPPAEPGTPGGTQREGFSLESVLREIERVKREAEQRATSQPGPVQRPRPAQMPEPGRRPLKVTRKAAPPLRPDRLKDVQDERGPLGRQSAKKLPSAEEMEDRTSLEVVDHDEGAEAVVERRIREAEARNRPSSEADHQSFHARLKEAEPAQVQHVGLTAQQLRQAFVWREILGPPKALE